MRLPAAAKDQRRWVTPEVLNVAPELVGVPLALPVHRACAMGVDLLEVAVLTGVSGLWLIGGLALVVLQLRSRGLARWDGPRAALGWVVAALVVLLALQEAGTQVQAWWHPEAAARARAEAAEEDAQEAARQAAEGLAEAAAEVRAASAPGVVLSALEQAASAASAAARARAQKVAASASAASAASPASAASAASAAAFDERARDRARIAELEAQLAKARRSKTLKEQVDSLLEDIGAGLGWGIVYFSLLPAWWGGQTVGKKLMGLKIVELTGQPMTVMRSLKRYGGYAAGVATGGLGLVQLLWDPNRQGLQDKAAHTVVIDLRGARRAVDAPAA